MFSSPWIKNFFSWLDFSVLFSNAFFISLWLSLISVDAVIPKPIGVFTSWAIPATISPSDAIFSVSTNCPWNWCNFSKVNSSSWLDSFNASVLACTFSVKVLFCKSACWWFSSFLSRCFSVLVSNILIFLARISSSMIGSVSIRAW